MIPKNPDKAYGRSGKPAHKPINRLNTKPKRKKGDQPKPLTIRVKRGSLK